MKIEFKKENQNSRSEFANLACKLLVKANGNNIESAVSNIQPLYDMFFDNVRNIYELVTSEIPLFTLYELTNTENLDDHCESYWEIDKKEAIHQVSRICVDWFCCA
jgi:hypothetical protein